jgi:hypothetical protein
VAINTGEPQMLTNDQRKLLIKGFKSGLPDSLLSKRLNIDRKHIYMFRWSMNISAKDVLENRLDSWADMISKGISLELIAEIYAVKPTSIRQMLWRGRQFSFRSAKEQLRLVTLSKQSHIFNKTMVKLFGL